MTNPAFMPTETTGAASAQALYRALLNPDVGPYASAQARALLDNLLNNSFTAQCELPAEPHELMGWMDSNVDAVGEKYLEYLARRKAGGPREMFANRSHALYFLAEVAPTKLVDGAWLFGSLAHVRDARFASLIDTYLEELGLGDPQQNHVTLYKNLLHRTGADVWPVARDEHYLQGAIQLALSQHGHELVAEMIGFNLGYEQLPYHLHVTSYELDELGIDPYYFTVHITVDNAASGHARQAVQAVLDLLPTDRAARREFYERVRRGFMLSDLGVSSTQIAQGFDLNASVVDIFQRKARYGRAAHADYCRIAGRTVNQWLSDASAIPAFLSALEQGGWINRHQDPMLSRFWTLLTGDGACMFGVFSAMELQMIYDWIAGDCDTYLPGPAIPGHERQKVNGKHLSHRAMLKRAERSKAASRGHVAISSTGDTLDPPDLSHALSPARHDTPDGLAATAQFARFFRSLTVDATIVDQV